MPNNYSRGKIYKIVCRKTGFQYFGSTTEPTLARRLAKHVANFKAWKNGSFDFVTSFTILEENDYYIELVELVSCSSNDELKVRERFHIQNNKCVNKNIPLRTKKEWNEDNKEKYKEQIAEKGKIYRDEHKEEIAEYHKEYAQTHKEELVEYKKEWYETNKEKIRNKGKVKKLFQQLPF